MKESLLLTELLFMASISEALTGKQPALCLGQQAPVFEKVSDTLQSSSACSRSAQ